VIKIILKNREVKREKRRKRKNLVINQGGV
jgi:hypothetical protein